MDFIKNRYLLLVSFAIFLGSCQDVINLSLKSSDPQLVIEGSVDNHSDSIFVSLHRSTDYYKPTTIQSVNDATVSLKDSSGNVYHFTNSGDGRYSARNLHGQPGESFSLSVQEGNSDYTAEATMPGVVTITKFYLDKEPDHPFEDRLNIQFTDPAGIENYYQVEIYVNDSLLTTGDRILIYSDKFFDGVTNVISLGGRRLGIDQFDHGDTVRVRLKNIEKWMYNYLDVLRSITSGMEFISASSPSNPPGNIRGGALGYFAAWAINERSVIKN
ncbi:MAG TPA: DUF4249 domain-containing protein [Bacteroidales bacterium]|nr:DUF4249 domain-containing protein [Bacteroidales bacterium]